MAKITMYYGASCPHCHRMMPIVDDLIEEGFEVEKKEVWNNDENAEEMRTHSKLIVPACGDGLGVPAFVDSKNKRALCGEQDPQELKKWLQEKK
jgi:glutaredoxin